MSRVDPWTQSAAGLHDTQLLAGHAALPLEPGAVDLSLFKPCWACLGPFSEVAPHGPQRLERGQNAMSLDLGVAPPSISSVWYQFRMDFGSGAKPSSFVICT